MTPDEHARAVEVFLDAVDLPAAERERLLSDRCPDPTLRSQVERMLAADAVSDTRLRGILDEEFTAFVEQGGFAPGDRIGNWRVERQLSRGGMGVIYEVRRADGSYEQAAALKILAIPLARPIDIERFHAERRILARLHHPGIARLIDGGAVRRGAVETPYLVMEYVEGVPLTEFVSSRRLPLIRRLALLLDVCHAVECAHQNMVVHRDLKPANILVDAGGRAKVLDFGISRLLDSDHDAGPPPEWVHAFTPPYASPEQVRGEDASTSADVYSLGVILQEMSAGVPTPLGLGTDLAAIIMQATHPSWPERYRSVEAFRSDLERLMNGLPVHARPATPLLRLRKFFSRHQFSALAGVAAVLALVAGLAATTWQARRAERRFGQVRALANTFLFRIYDQLNGVPGATQARETLVETALAYLESLRREAGHDPSLLEELASAYERVGDAQGAPADANTGRSTPALASYGRAVELRELLLRVQGSSVAQWKALATAHLKAGELEFISARLPGAEVHYQRAKAATGSALALAGPDGGVLELEAKVLTRLGSLRLRTGEPRQALADFQSALQRLQRFRAPLRSLWAAHMYLADTYLDLALPLQALTTLRQGEAHGRRLWDDPGTRQVGQRARLLQLQSVGDASGGAYHLSAGDPEAARAAYLQALTVAETMSRADADDAQSVSARALLEWRLAALAETSAPLDAERRARNALRLVDRLLVLSPGNAEQERNRLFFTLTLARCLIAQGKPQAGLAVLEQVRSPGTSDSGHDRPLVELVLGDARAAAGQPIPAASHWREGVRLSQLHAKQQPGDLSCHRWGAECAGRLKDPASRRDALAFWLGLARQEPANQFFARQVRFFSAP
ncbi:MAG: serine/threonine protein kinase [Bryobacterales bacterium]|nr:serine/threonine protein kinase [Bryobacterales bacterium]